MIKVEELCGYIPYGVKFMNNRDNEIVTLRYLGNDGYLGIIEEEFDNYDIKDIKLILHPLTDLVKAITVKDYKEGKKFVPMAELLLMRSTKYHTWGSAKKIAAYKAFCNDLLILRVDYDFIKKLYQWNFDIHGLIERGDATSINKLDEYWRHCE